MALVFISYSHLDDALAHRVADELVQRGHDVWIDNRILGGTTYSAEINFQIDDADAFVVLVTEHSVKSKEVTVEIGAALLKFRTNNLIFIPLSFDGAQLEIGSIEDIQIETCSRDNIVYIERVNRSIRDFKSVKEKEKQKQDAGNPAWYITKIQKRHWNAGIVIVSFVMLSIILMLIRIFAEAPEHIPLVIFLLVNLCILAVFLFLLFRIFRCVNTCDLALISLVQKKYKQSLDDLKKGPCIK